MKRDEEQHLNPLEDHSKETVVEPVLDGSEEHPEEVIDPRKGMTDPALIRHTETGKKSLNPYD